jgi:hypothetical protein
MHLHVTLPDPACLLPVGLASVTAFVRTCWVSKAVSYALAGATDTLAFSMP